MINKYNICFWLVDQLERRPMTLKEIQDSWARSVYNSTDSRLSQRSFHRYVNDIADMGLGQIECDKTTGYTYSLVEGGMRDKCVREWVLSSLRMASLGEKMKHNSHIVLEPPAQNTAYLEQIITAAERSHPIKFHYRSAYGVESDMEIVPVFAKMFRQRWYVVGARTTDQAPRTLAFDRMSNLQVLPKARKLAVKTVNLLNPDTYFADCLGIARMDDVTPQKIRIRAFYPQSNFFDEVPIHQSQQKVAEGENSEYCDYEFHLRPSFDFKQELLQYGRKVVVLEPESFRQEMIATLRDMVTSYETGRDMLME